MPCFKKGRQGIKTGCQHGRIYRYDRWIGLSIDPDWIKVMVNFVENSTFNINKFQLDKNEFMNLFQ